MLRRLASLTGDPLTAKEAERFERTVEVRHLMQNVPAGSRVVVGCRVDFSFEEGRLLG
jgi:hypothetical protein